MSEIKVNKISPRVACGTTQLGDSGDTFNLPSGATLTVASGATITNNGTQTGFGREGSVNWQTGSIKTTTFTAASGEGYFVNSGSALTMNLPAGSAGAIVAVADYARNFATYNLTVSPNGSEKIGGQAENAILDINGQAATFVYVDSTKGWINVQNAEDTEIGVPPYIGATGGTEATCGNFKTHIFTSPGTFTVSRVATCAADNVVDYLVVAGGGGGSGASGPGAGGRGGGGAGGGRTFQSTPTTNPIKAPAGITVTATAFPITVGGGGTAGPPSANGGKGNDSIFSTITSTGGGYGANHPSSGGPGGSGGGTFSTDTGGTGNDPPVAPPQGHPAVPVPSAPSGGTGGGGLGAAPPGSAPINAGTAGGIGSYVPDAFIGPTAPSYGTPGPESNTRYFAGGGGGGGYNAGGGAGGAGGGGNGANSYGPGGAGDPAPSGTDNTGGGGGGVGAAPPSGTNGGGGGSGIVMIRYRFQ